MEDVSPGLLKQIRDDFTRRIENSPTIKELYAAIQSGNATYIQAEDYAYEVGSALAEAFGAHLSSAVLPDGKMYYNIAQSVVRPMLVEDHAIVSDAAAQVQNALNAKAGIHIKAQTVPVNDNRVSGIIDKVSDADIYDDVAWVLQEPVKNFSMNVVDETLRANVDFQGKTGLRPRIIRRAERKCCEWCSQLEGVYDYPVEREIYQRHERCRCTVDYDPGTGKVQNVHTKQWQSKKDYDTMVKRRSFGLLLDTKRRYEPDIYIPKGVGAKQKNVLVKLPDGQRVTLTPGSRITKVQTIAGLGRNRQIDIVDILTDRYPGTDALKWQKKKGIGFVDYDGESYKAELHWYEEPTVGQVEFKIKPDADGNWFYEDE